MEEKTTETSEEVKETPAASKPKNRLLKIFIVFVVVALALTLTGLKYLSTSKNSITNINEAKNNITPSPSLAVSPTTLPTGAPTLTPTPTPTSVYTFGFKKGPYSRFEITMQPGWRAIPSTNNTDTRMNYIIDKYFPDNTYYSITLAEDLSFTSGKCTYPGETATGTDRAFVNFAEIPAGPITFRRGAVNAGDNIQMGCEKQIAGYENPTQFGNMLINFPKTNISADAVIEIDKIISSIREIN